MNRVTNGNLSTMDKSKDWQLEILMEKLRSKASQYKNLTEISKNVRMTMLDKRYALDSVDKSQHQKCLDTLQHSIKVTSLQSMVERLESLTRQLGLKFTVGPPVFISSDMFYLEILLEPNGSVKDVKVHHEGKEQQSCQELLNCLSRGDFMDFTAQLEGFASIYHLNAEKKIKEKAFTALQSLESDLSTLAQLQSFMKEPSNLLHKSPVGILEKRRGGHPMKLTYFVSPYELVSVERGTLEPLSVEMVTDKGLGCSVTVCVEGSQAHKLQTNTLITVNRNINGKSTPTFSNLNNQNSAVIPACFVLRLNKPMAMCVGLVQKIQQLTEMETIDLSTAIPLLNLIVKHASDGKLESGNNRGLFVTLPDQNHCYFMTENKNMKGILISSIPFTHPTHVSQILVLLRQQALFNTIISSCVRPNSRQDFENMTMFEVSALSWNHITISVEHPSDESMATAEIDLSDIASLVCRVQSPGTPPPANTPDFISEMSTKVLNRCFSIPVTMRAVIKQWDKQIMRRTHYNGHENFSLPLGSGDPGGHKGAPGPGMSEFGGLDVTKIKQEPSGAPGHGMMMQGQFLNESMMSGANFPNFPPSSEGVLSNIELTNILSGSSQSEKPMTKKSHKRRATDDLYRSGKKKAGDDTEMLMETSSNDSTSRSTPLSQEAVSETATSNSALGFHSDLELSGLDPTELLNTTDKQGMEFESMDDIGDVEDMLSDTPKSREQISTAKLLVDLGDQSLIPPNVSITPISTASSPGYNQTGSTEKRAGIEIIPLTTSSASVVPSSITITPITSSQMKSSEERSREKKSSKSKSDDRSKLEKKRKRKRDESPMGPPEKVPPKQDPLTKPVSVSIKPAESPPLPTSTPNSPNMVRKFNASPTHNRTMSMSGKLSPNLIKSNIKSGSSHHSPKHSPAHVSSSPKHIPGLSSPKSHGTSPKHPSTSGSGKPSMSALKNAANSPSSKTSSDSKSKSASKESSREKDKKLSSVFGVSNSKIKSSSVKVKPLDLNIGSEGPGVQDSLPSPGASNDSSKSSNSTRNRKGSLSAIVDKLKSAQCDSVTDLSSKSSGGSNSNRERSSQNSGKTSESSKSSGKLGDNKNSEYMVKHSSDGMKITINKTRSKESSKTNLIKSGSSTGTGSPKTHTGLKPGVNSGPASKKPQASKAAGGSSSVNSVSSSSSSSSSNFSSGSLKSSQVSTKTTLLGSSKGATTNTGSLSKSTSKLSSSPKTSSSSTDFSRSKDRPKLNKSSSDKSIFTSKEGRKSSPTPGKDEADGAFKSNSKNDMYTSSLIMEGLMKQLDKNFQIPKLSARASDDKKQSANKNMSDSLNSISRPSTVDTKIFDMTKSEVNVAKYPLGLCGNKMFENSLDARMRNNLNNISGSLVLPEELEHDKKELLQNLTSTQSKDDGYKMNYPLMKYGSSSSGINEPLSLSTKSVSDGSSKFAVPQPKEDKKDGKSEALLDYSKSDVKSSTLPFTATSPSVSVHIVKSPAPSPLVNPSPHSSSPCITDDELMDEALVGLGK